MQVKFILAIFIGLLGLPAVIYAGNTELTKINIASTPEGSRIVFTVSAMPQIRVLQLQHPNRLAVDFPQTQLKTNLQKITFASKEILHIREGHPTPTVLRLVFDLNQPVTFRLASQGTKINLDIAAGKPIKSKPTQPIVMKEKPRHRGIVVVIDPGHGGQDPGAVGEYGTQEKQVVLAISKQLAELINRNPNMRAVLTRDKDVFIPLIERLKLARKGKADLFIAIHADSFFNKSSSGVSVYALSRSGASTVAARWLSNRENHSELGGLNLKELEDQSVQLRSVLIDLAQTATIIDSLRLGNSLLKSLHKVTSLHYGRVEQAPFLVLKSPDIPSILVETGFLSNPKEELKLRDPQYQRKIASAILNGIQSYLNKYPTPL